MTHVARSLRLNRLVQLNTRILVGDGLEEQLRQDTSYVCAYCEDQVNFRCGETVRAHFAHAAGTRCWIENHEDWGPESAEHQHAKFWLCAQIHLETGFQTQIEAVIGERERIADILVLAAHCPARVAVEIQLSPIPVKKFIERTNSYIKNNVDVIWLVGRKNINSAKDLIKVNQINKNKFSLYLLTFENDECFIRSLKKQSPHDPSPQQLMMIDILRFMLARAKPLAKSGADLSRLLHGHEVDVVSYDRYLNYNDMTTRRINPFDLVELDEKKRMRELFLSKRAEEDRINNAKRLQDKSELERKIERQISYEKANLAKKHVDDISNNKSFHKDNAVILHCFVVRNLKEYKTMAIIKVSARDPDCYNDKIDRFWIDIKIYSPFIKKSLESIENGRNLIIYGHVERKLNWKNEWETHIVADVVDIL